MHQRKVRQYELPNEEVHNVQSQLVDFGLKFGLRDRGPIQEVVGEVSYQLAYENVNTDRMSQSFRTYRTRRSLTEM